jgi:hypothetical protein
MQMPHSSRKLQPRHQAIGQFLIGLRWLLPGDPTFPVAARDIASGSRFVVAETRQPVLNFWRGVIVN